MQKNVYMHSINNSARYTYDSFLDRKTLLKILKCNALLSMRMQGKDSNGNFAGSDYISLCDFEKRDIFYKKGYNAYYGYIRHGISLAFDKNINVIYPEIIKPCTTSLKGYRLMSRLGEGDYKYTDLPDEVFVKDCLSLSHLIYLTYPCEDLFDSKWSRKTSYKIKLLTEEIKLIKKHLIEHGYDVNIYDIDSETILNEEGIELVCKKH